MKGVGTLHTLDRNWGDIPYFVTVRKGHKYLGTEGEEFDLCECWTEYDAVTSTTKHLVVDKAVVEAVTPYTMGTIPAWALSHHYNEACRAYPGLLEAMRNAYGEVSEETQVVVVALRRLK